MANVLSQDEVDSLLAGIDEGKVETGTDIPGPEKEEELKAYDFSTQAGPIHLRLPALRIINERLVGFFRASLSTATGSDIEVTLTSTDSVKFGDFCSTLPLPTSLNIFKMEPLRGFAILVLEGPLVFSFVDSFFGGKGVSHVKLEGRGFTAIETKIVNKVTGIILGDLQRAWSDIDKLEMIYTRSEMDPQFAGIVTPDDMVIVIKFTVDLENASSSIILCIPFSTIEPVKVKLRQRMDSARLEVDETWQRYIEKKIGELTVNLSCTLGMAKISSRELLEMKVDDVIELDKRVGDSILVNVEGIPKFKGHPGSSNNNKAIRITDILKME